MKERASRNVRLSPELMAEWATRDTTGARLTWDWGEPDDEGFYEPRVTRHDDDRLGSLDSAWAEAEAALPEGWRIESVELSLWEASAGTTLWSADAGPADDSVGEYPEGLGPTPAAALRALAAKLRERQP